MISPFVDAWQVDGADAEVAVSELALDDDERDAFAGRLDGVGVTELVRREPASHARRGGRAPHVKPRLELLSAPGVHADLATAPSLAAPDQD
jgi:hypothetical protein